MQQSKFGQFFLTIFAALFPRTTSSTPESPSSSSASSPGSSSNPSSSSFVKLAWGNHQNVTQAFRKKAHGLAIYLGIEPDWLMACMAWETGPRARFTSTVRNAAGSGAIGLIQFMPKTLKDMGYTVEHAAAMTPVQQLDLVREYFEPYRGRLHSLSDVYMAILWPAAIGKPETSALWTQEGRPTTYRQNSGLDINRDGVITKAEAAAKVRATLEAGQVPPYIWEGVV